MGKVYLLRHQTRLWISVKGDRENLCGHCSCIAGLGEVCSHVGAIMFYLLLTSKYSRRNSENPCTSQPCSWFPPCLKKVEFVKLSSIDFSDPRKGLSKNKVVGPKQAIRRKFLRYENQKQQFYTKLHQAGMDCAILGITSGFCERFIPSVAEIRAALFNFYHEKYEQLFCYELIDDRVKEYMKININTNEVQLIEKKTREQSKSELWYRARSGVITASNFRACCHTDIAEPSKSLIMKICYPSKSRFSTEATDYGSKHEKMTRDVVIEYLSNVHENISPRYSGLFRSEVEPCLGASPDSILECSCCETIFLIEIKCLIKATKCH